MATRLKLNQMYLKQKNTQLLAHNAQEQRRKVRDVKIKQETLTDDAIYINFIK